MIVGDRGDMSSQTIIDYLVPFFFGGFIYSVCTPAEEEEDVSFVPIIHGYFLSDRCQS